MKVSFTLQRESLAMVIPRPVKPQVTELFHRCDEKHGGYVSVTLETPYKPRSTGYKSQNHAINGYCQQISKETGEDFSVVKLECKKRAFTRGYPLMERDNQIVYSKITGEPIPESESMISSEQAGYLIETIIQLAAELGIILEE